MFHVRVTHLLLLPSSLSRLTYYSFLLVTLFGNLSLILIKHDNKTPSVNQAPSSGLPSLVINLYLSPRPLKIIEDNGRCVGDVQLCYFLKQLGAMCPEQAVLSKYRKPCVSRHNVSPVPTVIDLAH